ncbi:DUF6252 family protein [Winogradskyella pulchriflava]|uniref:DUF6252 family protein n=1 Tax=Winogradskyella pulchriflava TaxID=1110688 RepID=A0ABV6Q8R0_9FLAO
MKKILFLLMTVTLLFACSSSSDDSDGFGNLNGTYISARVNGDSFLANGEEFGAATISASMSSSGSFFSFGIAGVDLNGSLSGQGDGIVLGFTGLDFDLVVDGFEIDNQVESDFIFVGAYGSSSMEEDDIEFVEDSGYLKVTDIDKNAQVISGEFRFDVYNATNGQTIEIRQGVFNEIEYTIQN